VRRFYSQEFDMSNKNQIYRMPKVIEVTGLPESSIRRLQAAGKFPQSFPTTEGRSVGFDARAVHAWVDEKCSAAKVAK
jgi:predicted DNA-binding transcriptional regulator AlpA